MTIRQTFWEMKYIEIYNTGPKPGDEFKLSYKDWDKLFFGTVVEVNHDEQSKIMRFILQYDDEDCWIDATTKRD